MRTLREETREALARTEPDTVEARRTLDDVLARAKLRERARTRFLLLLAPAAVVAGVVAVFLWRGTTSGPLVPPPVSAAPSPPTRIHLHLHVAGEPAERDLTLDLNDQGAR